MYLVAVPVNGFMERIKLREDELSNGLSPCGWLGSYDHNLQLRNSQYIFLITEGWIPSWKLLFASFYQIVIDYLFERLIGAFISC